MYISLTHTLSGKNKQKNIQKINSVRFWWKIPILRNVVTAWHSILCLVHSALQTIFIRMHYEQHNMIKHINRAMGMCLAFPKDGCKIFNRVLNWNFSGFCSHQDIDLAQLDRDDRPACWKQVRRKNTYVEKWKSMQVLILQKQCCVGN